MKSILTFLLLCVCCHFGLNAQIAAHNLVGYWQNWNYSGAPYIQLNQIDSRYSIVEVSFALPVSTTDMTITFTPDGVTQADFIAKLQAAKAQGKKVLISLGGATGVIDLTTTINKTAFTNSLMNILNTYDFDGLDIDIEGSNSIQITGGTIAAPTNVSQINLINALKQIMQNYRLAHSNKKMLLTLAPETAYVQGGQSAFSGVWGGYLPILDALRDSIDLVQVQLYNSGTMYGIDGVIYTQGTADFIVAMTEAVIKGFNTSGGLFRGFPASKVAIGLPACASAGGGFTSMANVTAAMKYLWGIGPKPGSYTLATTGGYPTLNGMMTWSVNWDAVASCGGAYTYAATYQTALNDLLATIPVELMNFQAKPLPKTVQLTWQTASEINSDYFTIERGADGKFFDKIGQIQANGNSSALKNYSFTDNQPLNEANYYRLQQIDKDGKVQLSPIIAVDFAAPFILSIFPNPVTNLLTFSGENVGEYAIFDAFGREILRGPISSNLTTIDMAALISGVYILKIKDKVLKFTKL